MQAHSSGCALPAVELDTTSVAPTTPTAAVTVQAQGSLDPYRFNMLMRDLLAEHSHDITWMSGVLNIQVWMLILLLVLNDTPCLGCCVC